jgi:hypothetical protein
MAER